MSISTDVVVLAVDRNHLSEDARPNSSTNGYVFSGPGMEQLIELFEEFISHQHYGSTLDYERFLFVAGTDAAAIHRIGPCSSSIFHPDAGQVVFVIPEAGWFFEHRVLETVRGITRDLNELFVEANWIFLSLTESGFDGLLGRLRRD
ncbi:hypothetical protein [Edaphobacter aggregans]|uniref:hypothetical protein n=1 Tax=Edaphobacter aggregans TaxID=570835 RepID=UPI0014707637|nr:hypothetical protein [Edaphobacter aggregans]